MPLGYCDGETKPIENLSSAKAGVWSSGAIYIPASTAATIAGCKITGMRYGIGFKMNIDGAKIWIRTSLDGADLAAKTVDTDASELVTRRRSTNPGLSPRIAVDSISDTRCIRKA